MKKIKNIVAIFLFFVTICLSACQFQAPDFDNEDVENNGGSVDDDQNNDNTENPDNSEKRVIDLIIEEYKALVKFEKNEKTTWTFEGFIIDMSATTYNDLYENYEVTMILDVSGIRIGISKGQVDGNYPVDITGLQNGVQVTVEGQIDQFNTVESGSVHSSICFYKPEISWTFEDDNNGNNPDDDNSEDSDSVVNKVNFAMINDTHGAFTDSNDGTSIGRVDTLLDGLEEQYGDYIKIANGDILQGSYVSSKTYGRALIESLNLMDFDAFVIGNHEFDWGLDKVAQYKDGDLSNGEANYPFLGANIFYKGTNERPEWIDAYTIVNYGDLKVGIIGLIGGTYESSILATYVNDYNFLDNPTQLVSNYAKELRTEKNCDVVVIATHDYDEVQNSRFANLSGDSRVDAIFCAHTHQKISESLTRKDGVKIPVVQNYDKNDTVQEVVIQLKDSDMSGYTTKIYSMKDYDNEPRYEISDDLEPLYQKYDSLIVESNSKIGYTSSSFNKTYIGKLTTQAMVSYDYGNDEYSNISLAVINTGGVRATIDRGDITMAEVFNTFPFENAIYLIKAPGSLLNTLVNDSYYYTYSTSSSFNQNVIYTVAVIDYVYVNKYNVSLFSSVVSEYSTGIIMRDVFIDYLIDKYN
jgi:2',3'-cyclic-nucleotide 2'-phosphodiesterase (5'-nucleotidase family)